MEAGRRADGAEAVRRAAVAVAVRRADGAVVGRANAPPTAQSATSCCSDEDDQNMAGNACSCLGVHGSKAPRALCMLLVAAAKPCRHDRRWWCAVPLAVRMVTSLSCSIRHCLLFIGRYRGQEGSTRRASRVCGNDGGLGDSRCVLADTSSSRVILVTSCLVSI